MGTENTQDRFAAWLPCPTSVARSTILPHGHEANASVTSSSQSEVQHKSKRAHLQSEGRDDTVLNRAHHGGSATMPGRALDLSPKPCYPASTKDWEEQRANITRLYATEDRPLSKVATEMNVLYGFEATSKQYKSRITRWHLDKNIKDEEMRTILREQQRRRLQGKDSVFVVRGRKVDPKKIERYVQRKGVNDALQDISESSTMCPDMQCYTPKSDGYDFSTADDSLQPIFEFDSSEIGNGHLSSNPIGPGNVNDVEKLAHTHHSLQLEPSLGTHASVGTNPALPPLKSLIRPVAKDEDEQRLNEIVELEEAKFILPTTTNHLSSSTLLYGFDCGQPDTDLPKHKHNDHKAIKNFTGFGLDYFRNCDQVLEEELCTDLQYKDIAPDNGKNYYRRPVSIRLSESLPPLPDLLKTNPMNLMYFHHFINHTARLLVAHDCPDNPFRTILPAMAISYPNLLKVLLAYSALNRALLLDHPPPINRINIYLQEVFPAVRHALADIDVSSSEETLAITIMLASMEETCGSHQPYQLSQRVHLGGARSLITFFDERRRGDDKTIAFLGRWFAYIDTITGLMHGRSDRDGQFSEITDYSDLRASLGHHESRMLKACNTTEKADGRIDCLSGLSRRCLLSLAEVRYFVGKAKLARCEAQEPASMLLTLSSVATSFQLELKREDIANSIPCKYGDAWDFYEMTTINRAFEMAGLVHLNRELFGLERSHSEVKIFVTKILTSLHTIRKGSPTEACLLFPLVTAACACEIQSQGLKKLVVERFISMARLPTVQVRNAWELIRKAWPIDLPWASLVVAKPWDAAKLFRPDFAI